MPSNSPTPGRSRGRPPATSADAIARTGLTLFTDQGFETTTMDDVAAACGIARRTLFTYYRSKAAIVWDGQSEATAAITAALADVPTQTPWVEGLLETLPQALRYPADDLGLLRTRLVLISENPTLRAHLAGEQDAAVDAVTAFIAARSSAEEPADGFTAWVCARAALTAMTAALTWWASSDEPDPRATVRRALEAVLTPRPPSP